MLRPAGILECCIYAGDLDAAESFYAGVLGLEPFAREAGRHVFFRAGPSSVFLVFDPARTGDPGAQSAVGGVPVPRHGATGPGHVAFPVAEAELDAWRERFTAAGVAVEAEIRWPRGGRSIYVRDPAGNSVELATPRIWGLDEPSATG
jgi:catechol 2,3-dioxygenase-like lactoylglutathione lyase family enzyme